MINVIDTKLLVIENLMGFEMTGLVKKRIFIQRGLYYC